eukprot:869175-Rhodomonas_salina.1
MSTLLSHGLPVIVKRTPQRDGGRESRGRQVVVRLPPINDEAVVNPQLDAFVGLSDASLESENFGRSVVRVIEKLQETSPPHREALLVGKAQVAKAARDSVVESALRIRDIKVDLILLPRRHWLGELHVIVVRGVQARALRQARVDLVVSLDSWRVGDFVARAQGEQPARGDDRRCVRRHPIETQRVGLTAEVSTPPNSVAELSTSINVAPAETGSDVMVDAPPLCAVPVNSAQSA